MEKMHPSAVGKLEQGTSKMIAPALRLRGFMYYQKHLLLQSTNILPYTFIFLGWREL